MCHRRRRHRRINRSMVMTDDGGSDDVRLILVDKTFRHYLYHNAIISPIYGPYKNNFVSKMAYSNRLTIAKILPLSKYSLKGWMYCMVQ